MGTSLYVGKNCFFLTNKNYFPQYTKLEYVVINKRLQEQHGRVISGFRLLSSGTGSPGPLDGRSN
jgi:hypothetical protein